MTPKIVLLILFALLGVLIYIFAPMEYLAIATIIYYFVAYVIPIGVRRKEEKVVKE